MRISYFAFATLLLAVTGVAATAEAGYSHPAAAQYEVLHGQNGGSATGGPAGGLPDRN